MTAIIVGAYAAAPPDPTERHRNLDALAAAGIDGLEIPWQGPAGGPAWDDPVRSGWRQVVTGVQRADAHSRRDPSYGLASPDPEGRRAALSEVRAMCDGIRRRNDELGGPSVRAVELQTPPRGSRGTAEQLATSLEELGSWDWDGAELLVEHCDASMPGRTAAKGFLSLEQELRALDLTSGVGLVLNWGRSAIELRSADAVLEHVAEARASGHLRGIVFSGAGAVAGPYGEAWADAHLPLHDEPPRGTRDSLLTAAHVARTIDVAGALDWVGIKMSSSPAGQAGMLHALEVVREALRAHRG